MAAALRSGCRQLRAQLGGEGRATPATGAFVAIHGVHGAGAEAPGEPGAGSRASRSTPEPPALCKADKQAVEVYYLKL